MRAHTCRWLRVPSCMKDSYSFCYVVFYQCHGLSGTIVFGVITMYLHIGTLHVQVIFTLQSIDNNNNKKTLVVYLTSIIFILVINPLPSLVG